MVIIISYICYLGVYLFSDLLIWRAKEYYASCIWESKCAFSSAENREPTIHTWLQLVLPITVIFFFALHSSFSTCLSIALLRLHHMWTIKGEYKFRLSLSALILIDHFCHFSLFFQSTIGLFREMTYTHSSILSLNGDHFCSEIIPCYDNVIIDFARGNILFNKQRLDKIVSFDFDGRLVCCTLQ